MNPLGFTIAKDQLRFPGTAQFRLCTDTLSHWGNESKEK